MNSYRQHSTGESAGLLVQKHNVKMSLSRGPYQQVDIRKQVEDILQLVDDVMVDGQLACHHPLQIGSDVQQLTVETLKAMHLVGDALGQSAHCGVLDVSEEKQEEHSRCQEGAEHNYSHTESNSDSVCVSGAWGPVERSYIPEQVLHTHFLCLFCTYLTGHMFKRLRSGCAILREQNNKCCM